MNAAGSTWRALGHRRGIMGMTAQHLLITGALGLLLAMVLIVVLVPVMLHLKRSDDNSHLNGQYRSGLPCHSRVNLSGPGSFLRIGPNMQTYIVVGFNSFNLCEMARVPAWAPWPPLGNQTSKRMGGTRLGQSGRVLVLDSLARAAAMGMNTLRTWAHTSNSNSTFQISPGVYDEEGLVALDYIVHVASLLGLRVILCLVDNWHYYNGVDQYVDWSPSVPPRSSLYRRLPDNPGDPSPVRIKGDAPAGAQGTYVTSEDDGGRRLYERLRHALFWSDAGCAALYRAHAHAMTHRRNSFNGLLYRDDPTIMAWDLVNEMRCEAPGCHQAVQTWVEEMALYVKAQAPNQLLTIGSEGFFGPSTPHLLRFNPGAWAAESGQDFVANNAAEGIDFASLHAWPEHWGIESTPYPTFIRSWVSSHLGDGSSTSTLSRDPRPVLLEEFGRKLSGPNNSVLSSITALRDPVFESTYRLVEEVVDQQSGVNNDQPEPKDAGLLGSIFWSWSVPVYNDASDDEYGILPGHSSAAIASQHARLMANTSASITFKTGKAIGLISGKAICNNTCWKACRVPAAAASDLVPDTSDLVPDTSDRFESQRAGRLQNESVSDSTNDDMSQLLPSRRSSFIHFCLFVVDGCSRTANHSYFSDGNIKHSIRYDSSLDASEGASSPIPYSSVGRDSESLSDTSKAGRIQIKVLDQDHDSLESCLESLRLGK